MRVFLILSAIVAIVIFLMPFILSAVIFSIAAAALLMLLASFGLLPGVTPRRRGWIRNDSPRANRRRKTYSDKDERVSEENENNGGRDFHKDNEVIILPETALYKDEHAKPRPPGPFSV
jgi:hypothetical protein